MKKQVILGLCAVLFGCSAPTPQGDTPSEVLEPVSSAEESTPESAQTPIESPVPAAFEKLKAKLDQLDYEGVGLEHETVEVIERLTVVFSDPAMARRRIKSIYTGAANDYDPINESLTLGGTAKTQAMVAFIKKKVPLKTRTK